MALAFPGPSLPPSLPPATFLCVGTCNTGEDLGHSTLGFMRGGGGGGVHVALVQSIWGDTVHGETGTGSTPTLFLIKAY